MGRKIEDVVFHDPRRHDENRLRRNRIGRGCILDQFDEFVAEYHPAGGRREIPSDAKRILACGTAAHGFLDVGQHVEPARQEVFPALLDRGGDHFRVEPWHVGGREGIYCLADREGYQPLVRSADAGQPRRRLFPPLLREQKRLGESLEGRLLPGRVPETVVGTLRLDGGLAAREDAGEPPPLAQGLDAQFGTVERRVRHMGAPVEQRAELPNARKPAGKAALQRMKHGVEQPKVPGEFVRLTPVVLLRQRRTRKDLGVHALAFSFL